jgi:hypothetical protein
MKWTIALEMNRHNLEESFFFEKLNPLFLQGLKKYWEVLQKASSAENDKVQTIKLQLFRYIFRHLFQHLYLQNPPLVQGSLFVLGSIHPDGLGDYYALLKTANVLKQNYPQLQINVVYRHQCPLPKIDPPAYLLQEENIHSFLETSDISILEPILEGCLELPYEKKIKELKTEYKQMLGDFKTIKLKKGYEIITLKEWLEERKKLIEYFEKFREEKKRAKHVYQQMKKALAIVNVALALNTFDQPRLGPKSMYFAETGNFTTIANYLQRHWFSMGFGEFEEGIFLQKIPLKLGGWQDEVFKKLVEKKEAYSKTHCLYLAYLPKIPHQMLVFIHLVCCLQANESRDIDIVLPSMTAEDFHLDEVWLKKQGISKVIFLNREINRQVLYDMNCPGKNLRLLNLLPLPTNDFEKLLSLSEDVMGCTGDGSLSDCLIQQKIPFYEMRKHKLETGESFIKMADFLKLEDVKAYFEEIVRYHELTPSLKAEEIHKLLKKPLFKKQMKLLNEFIQHYYCYENALLAQVNRLLWIKANPSIKLKEEKLVQHYFENKITAKQAYHIFSDYISNKLKSVIK